MKGIAMTNGISNRQMVFILILTLTTYSLLDISRAMAASAGTGSWFTLVITAVLFALAAMVIVSLNKRFMGKMLFDYSQEIVGKIGGYSISVFYVLYFLFVAVFLALQISSVLKFDFFPKTPSWATMLVGLPVFCYVAYKGIPSVARMCEILGVIFIVVLTAINILMASQGKIERIRPIFVPSEIGSYFSAIKQAIVPFLGIEILLIMPLSKKNGKKGVRTAFFAIMTIGLFYILVVESSIMKVGINDIVNYKNSALVAIRDISVPALNFFERVDMIYVTFGFIGSYMGISIVLTAIVEYLCKIFAKAKRWLIVIIVGAAIYALFLSVRGILGYADFASEVILYTGLGAGIIIPTILLITAKVKKNGA